jgi:tetratricopeptide (TPR) repeat protein
MNRKLFTLGLVAALPIAAYTATSHAQAPDTAPAVSPSPSTYPSPHPAQRDPLYNEGMRAMDEGRWADAVAAFDKEAAKNPNVSQPSLYWKAYSLEKLGRHDEANATCDVLRVSSPASSWNGECVRLRVQSSVDTEMLKAHTVDVDRSRRETERALREAESAQLSVHPDTVPGVDVGPTTFLFDGDTPGKSRQPIDPNDDIKLLALNSLMRQEPEKALPLLRTFIFSDKPLELRRRALFVLGESKAPGAQELLTEIATKNADVELQRIAVQTLATMHGKEASPELVKIYRDSTDRRVKKTALNGLFLARDASGLVDLARSEKDLEMKREIVSQLALMRDPIATAYMEELLK